MRLEVVDTPPENQRAHYRAVRQRLRSGPRKVPDVHPTIPPTSITWTFGRFTAQGNVIHYDFNPISISMIINEVCAFYKVRRMDLLSDRRTADLMHPRHVAMYLAKTLTTKSLPTIGKVFGRDHTTVLHACRKIGALLDTDERMADEVAILHMKLSEGA